MKKYTMGLTDGWSQIEGVLDWVVTCRYKYIWQLICIMHVCVACRYFCRETSNLDGKICQ